MTNKNPLTNASISTMWAIDHHPKLDDFFSLSRQLGFTKIELNHQIDSEMLSRVNLDHYLFSSIHEPCPADISTRELVDRDWVISSHDEYSRIQGVCAVKKSIKLAHDLSAPVVVVHCGNVSTEMTDETKLRDLYKAGHNQSDEYHEIKAHFIEHRVHLADQRLQAVKRSLFELIEYADRLNIKLGLENRYHYMDIPTIDEMEELLSLVDSNQLGFIYDVGHAEHLDRLGFFSHADWFNRFASRIIGTHLHDIAGLSDHLAPGLGEIDFKHIAGFLPDQSFRTIELKPGNTLAHIEYGLRILVQAGCIKYL